VTVLVPNAKVMMTAAWGTRATPQTKLACADNLVDLLYKAPSFLHAIPSKG